MFPKTRNIPNDMLHTPNTHIMPKTCITWTQTMFKCHHIAREKKLNMPYLDPRFLYVNSI
jgi:hypothetical protein